MAPRFQNEGPSCHRAKPSDQPIHEKFQDHHCHGPSYLVLNFWAMAVIHIRYLRHDFIRRGRSGVVNELVAWCEPRSHRGRRSATILRQARTIDAMRSGCTVCTTRPIAPSFNSAPACSVARDSIRPYMIPKSEPVSLTVRRTSTPKLRQRGDGRLIAQEVFAVRITYPSGAANQGWRPNTRADGRIIQISFRCAPPHAVIALLISSESLGIH